MSGPQSVIYIYKAALSVVETIVSSTEIDVSEADMVVSALPTSFFAAELIISAAEKTTGGAAGVFQPSTNQQVRMSAHIRPLAGFKNMADQQLVTTASAVLKEMTDNANFPNPVISRNRRIRGIFVGFHAASRSQ